MELNESTGRIFLQPDDEGKVCDLTSIRDPRTISGFEKDIYIYRLFNIRNETVPGYSQSFAFYLACFILSYQSE